MKKKDIEIQIDLFETKSIEKAINKLRFIRKTLPLVNREFMKESLNWIKERANFYLNEKVGYFKGSANISDSWNITPSNSKYGGKAYQLINDNKFVAYVEFGTGIVGKNEPHKKAEETGYEYDVNGHEENGWNFRVNFNNTWHIFNGFTGYEGKSFLYDAFFDYFHLGKWKEIYQEIYNVYIY